MKSRLTWYDPWLDFQQVRNQTSGQPAYSELVRLVTALNTDPATTGRFRGFSPESQSKILDWCGQHGLLGVLLSRWESATLSPRADRLDPTLRIQNRYIRGSGTDIEIRRTTGDLDQPRSGALIHLLNEYEIKNEPLGKTWYRFFPSVPKQQREVFAYPVPYGRRFWRLYAEPEMEFWHAAKLFAGIVEHFGPATKAIAGKPRKRSEALATKQNQSPPGRKSSAPAAATRRTRSPDAAQSVVIPLDSPSPTKALACDSSVRIAGQIRPTGRVRLA